MSEPKLRVTFIGTGVMGGPMAGHLVRAGHSVTVYNRTRAKAAHLRFAQEEAVGQAHLVAGRRRAAVVPLLIGSDVLGSGAASCPL